MKVAEFNNLKKWIKTSESDKILEKDTETNFFMQCEQLIKLFFF